jgi:hypothetical protein
MYIGPDEVLLTFDVQFLPGVSAGQVAAAVRAIELRIRERFPKIRRIYIEASSIADSPTPAARPDESSE